MPLKILAVSMGSLYSRSLPSCAFSQPLLSLNRPVLHTRTLHKEAVKMNTWCVHAALEHSTAPVKG